MRALIEWLAAHVEPYVSFRYLLGMVFGAMLVHWIVARLLWLRDLARPGGETSERDRALIRIAKSYAGVLLLRTFSLRTLRASGGLVAQIVVLLAAAIWLNVLVFAGER